MMAKSGAFAQMERVGRTTGEWSSLVALRQQVAKHTAPDTHGSGSRTKG
jgi:hypothetical protein